MDQFKVCPRCQHKSSQAKNYCDRCGTEFAAQTPPPAGPDAAIPQTLIMSPGATPGQPPPAQGFNLPQAGHSQQLFAPIPTPGPRAAPKTLTPSAKRRGSGLTIPFLPSGLGYFVRSVLSLLLLLALGFCALLFGLQHYQSHTPKAVAKRTAERYLAFMASGDYVDAYDMLTAAAKASCKIDDFRLMMDSAPWSWADARVAQLDAESAVVEYDLTQAGRPPRKDYVSLVLEGGAWSRPFNRGMNSSARAALEEGHQDMAFLKAQEAISVDPRDPIARGMLCEAAYARRLPDEIERQCGLALETARKYSSALGAAGLYRIYALLAATLHANRQYSEAAQAYTAMLGFPGISNDDVCRLSFARAQAYGSLGQLPQAEGDLDRAAAACANQADKAAALRQKAALSRPGVDRR